MTLFELGGNVDDKRGAHVGERNRVEDLEGAVGFALEGQLLQPRQEARLVTQRRGVVVVGVTRLPVGKNHGFGAEFADNGSEPQLVLPAWLHVGIGYSKGATPLDGKQRGCFSGFFGAGLGCTPCSHFAPGQLEDSGFVSALRLLQRRTRSRRSLRSRN